MKKIVIKTWILAHYQKYFRIIVETDFSDIIYSGIFSQLGKDRQLY